MNLQDMTATTIFSIGLLRACLKRIDGRKAFLTALLLVGLNRAASIL